MEKSDFKVIKGGIPDDASETKRPSETDHVFRSAWMTDTRLMAVTAMHIAWELPDPDASGLTSGKAKGFDDARDADGKVIIEGDSFDGAEVKDEESHPGVLHQFFYFDAVETGFDRYEELRSDDPDRLSEMESSFAGGLGGSKVDLTLTEAVHVFRHYYELSKKLGMELPEETGYEFLLGMDGDLDEEAEKALFDKMCHGPLTSNERINYFMMQVANRDEECLEFLSGGELGLSCCENKDILTLYKNDIVKETHESGLGHEYPAPGKSDTDRDVFIAESLLESENGYEIWKSKLAIEDEKVVSYERTTKLEISDTEAFLTLSHPEFIMVYSIEKGMPEMDRTSTPLTKMSTKVDEDDGTSFMLFRPNNDHVNTENYRLYDDIFGVYHITTTGQLVTAANTKHDMAMLELDLVFTPLFQHMELIGNYEFNEPVMAQFLASGYDDFYEFMDEITTEDD